MVLFNYSTRELTAKIVYYGPGICGKTTNLQFIHENLPGEVRGKMLSLATKTDRTLFFDFLPIDLGEIRGMKTRVQLYTVPGQVFYNETRKLVLKGVDGIVFVADSQETMLGANVESFKNLEENLKAHGAKLAEIPHVIQFNKRDLPKLATIEDMNAGLNRYNAPFYESVATTGIGVQDTLKAIVKLVLLNLTKKYETKSNAETMITAAAAAKRANASVATVPPPVARAASTASALAVSDEAVPAEPATMAPAAAARPAAPPKSKSVRKPAPPPPPVETMTPFAEEEIDGLVGEVEDIDPPVMPAPFVPSPVMPPPAPVEEGAWMGLPEGSEEPGFTDGGTTYGGGVPLEDLLGQEPPSTQEVSPVPVQDWMPAENVGSGFEIDRGFDPDWARDEDSVPEAVPRPSAPPPIPVAAFDPAPASVEDLQPITPFPLPESEPVLLTDVASDDDLFTDPSLEVARLAEGEGREIVVPVMLGDGPNAKRFKLAIRLRLDPVD